MFKKVIFLLSFVFVLILGCTTYAAEGLDQNVPVGTFLNEPAGFGDLYWGESLDEVTRTHDNKYLGEVSGSEQYGVMVKDTHGDLYLRGNVVVFAVFWDGKLHALRIPLMGQYSKIILPLTQMYGMPEFDNSIYTWKGNKSFMMLGPTNKEQNDGMIYLVDATFGHKK